MGNEKIDVDIGGGQDPLEEVMGSGEDCGIWRKTWKGLLAAGSGSQAARHWMGNVSAAKVWARWPPPKPMCS